jgi:hypothetical protein
MSLHGTQQFGDPPCLKREPAPAPLRAGSIATGAALIAQLPDAVCEQMAWRRSTCFTGPHPSAPVRGAL